MSRARAIRVVVGEDHPIFRDGLVHVLEQNGLNVVATASDAPTLIDATARHRPDLVIADIQIPPDRTDDGLRAVLTARKTQPDLCIVLLSQFLDDRFALELMADSAERVGYLLKEKVGDVATFIESICRVADGGTALDPDVVSALVRRPRTRGPLDELTKREREVLSLIAEGLSNIGIAERLFLSVGAVERHVAHIYAKLGLRDSQQDHRRVLAVLEYVKR